MNNNHESPRVHMDLSLEQAQAFATAGDVFSRLGIGQLNIVGEMVRAGTIPRACPEGGKRTEASIEDCETVDDCVIAMKRQLGYPEHGSHGIGHPHVAAEVHRAFEVTKVLRQALAQHVHPNPAPTSTHHDGLIVRYTEDPLPLVTIGGAGAAKPQAGGARYDVGAQVQWTSQASGHTLTKLGTVEQVVAPGGLPDRERYASLHAATPRDHESYVVRVKGRGVYWPRVSGLKSA